MREYIIPEGVYYALKLDQEVDLNDVVKELIAPKLKPKQNSKVIIEPKENLR